MMDFEREIERWAESVALRESEADAIRAKVLAEPAPLSVDWWRKALTVRGLPSKSMFALA